MTNGEPLDPAAAERRARGVVRRALESYVEKRVGSYETLDLPRLLTKDVLMIALRGVTTASELVTNLFGAFESSSEETHMGETMQEVAIGLAGDAVDLGDMVLERDGVLWVTEVKSQTNTVNARSRPQIIRVLKRRVEQARRIRASRPRDVKAMIAVLRGNPRDSEMTFVTHDNEDHDIDGFPYRYLVGRPFWEWLTGRPSIYSLIGEIEELATAISGARTAAQVRLQQEMDEWLASFGNERSVGTVLRLLDQQRGPRRPRARRRNDN